MVPSLFTCDYLKDIATEQQQTVSFCFSVVNLLASKRSLNKQAVMAAWPPIGTRSTPVDNTTPTTGSPALNPSPTIEPNTREVTFNLESHSNPYFLHHNESPALMLVSTPLDGPNYHPWARALSMALSCKNKIKFVNGSILKPDENDPKFDVWGRCNDMVMSWIVRSLSPTIGRSVLWIDMAYAACFELLHMDIWGPYRVATTHGHLYFLTIVDDHSRAVWVHLLRKKSEVRNLIVEFCKMVENQFGVHVKSHIDSPRREFPQIILPTDTSKGLSDDPQGQYHTVSPEQTSSPPNEASEHAPEQSYTFLPEHTLEEPQQLVEKPQQPVIRRSTRQRHTPTYLKDYMCHNSKIGSPLNPDYDSDYAEFLAEFLAHGSLGDTTPASPATPDTTFPASETDRLSPPSQTPSIVSTDSPAASA
nr:uncharacterized protein LOC109150247 [Ipomoea trifida]